MTRAAGTKTQSHMAHLAGGRRKPRARPAPHTRNFRPTSRRHAAPTTVRRGLLGRSSGAPVGAFPCLRLSSADEDGALFQKSPPVVHAQTFASVARTRSGNVCVSREGGRQPKDGSRAGGPTNPRLRSSGSKPSKARWKRPVGRFTRHTEQRRTNQGFSQKAPGCEPGCATCSRGVERLEHHGNLVMRTQACAYINTWSALSIMTT